MIEPLKTKEEFAAKIKEIESQPGYRKPIGFGIARVDRGQKNKDKVLQATFPVVNWGENFGSAAIFMEALKGCGKSVDCSKNEVVHTFGFKFIQFAKRLFAPYMDEAFGDAHKNVQVIQALESMASNEGMVMGDYKAVFIFEDVAPESVEAVYLKLYALSTEKAPLRSLNLNGAFGILTNVAWSGNMPIELEWLRENEIDLKLRGEYPVIDYNDKFPRYLMHVIPADNTRVLDTSKVRMGAVLAAGTTVMPGASYINFNAGTTGSVMVEGRISSSAIVGAGSDVGGGASILGVLSGTDGNPISIGKNCLLGANSTTGIPLGDGCIIDAGIAILEGTKVAVDKKGLEELNPGFDFSREIYKGKELAGLNGLHFRQNSQNGQVTAKRSTKEVKLNEDLH